MAGMKLEDRMFTLIWQLPGRVLGGSVNGEDFWNMQCAAGLPSKISRFPKICLRLTVLRAA